MFLIFLLSLIGPRVALFFTWLFTSWVDRSFDGFVWPLLGLLFAPWTTLAYVVMWQVDGLSGIGWLVVAIGLFADMGSYTGGVATRQ